MSSSKPAQGDSKTVWDEIMEWIKWILDVFGEKFMEWMFNIFREKESHPGYSYRDQREKPFCAGKMEREKNNEALESTTDEVFQDLKNKMKALNEDFKKLQEIKKELERNLETKEQGIARVLESMLSMNLRQLSRRIRTLAEDVEEWPEMTKDELHLCRAYLEMNKENKEEEIARILESKLKRNLRRVSRKIESVAEDVQDCLETATNELQLLRAELKKNQGNKEEDIARALESRLNMNLWQRLREFQTVDDVSRAPNPEFLRFISSP